MGYADIGEEEDWGRSDQGGKETDDQQTSKKRKDGSTAGQAAQYSIEIWPYLVTGVACSNKQLRLLQIRGAARGKALSQIPEPSSACRACSEEHQLGLCNGPQQLISPVRTS